MTLQEIRQSDKAFLTPGDVCEVLGCAQYSINVQAHQDPSKLGFPVCVMGRRVKVSRLGFLNWIDGKGVEQ